MEVKEAVVEVVEVVEEVEVHLLETTKEDLLLEVEAKPHLTEVGVYPVTTVVLVEVLVPMVETETVQEEDPEREVSVSFEVHPKILILSKSKMLLLMTPSKWTTSLPLKVFPDTW